MILRRKAVTLFECFAFKQEACTLIKVAVVKLDKVTLLYRSEVVPWHEVRLAHLEAN